MGHSQNNSVRIISFRYSTELFPSGIAADNAGNVYVVDAETDIYKSLQLMVHLLKNGTFTEQQRQNHFLQV